MERTKVWVALSAAALAVFGGIAVMVTVGGDGSGPERLTTTAAEGPGRPAGSPATTAVVEGATTTVKGAAAAAAVATPTTVRATGSVPPAAPLSPAAQKKAEEAVKVLIEQLQQTVAVAPGQAPRALTPAEVEAQVRAQLAEIGVKLPE